MSDNFKNLLKLLDDDNEQSASIAMAELLQQDDPRLERILRSLQETSDAKLRRRIHQLQSAIIKRRNRRQLGEALERNEVSLLEGILRLHLLWFDNDTRGEISDQWNDFLAEIGKRSCSTPRRLLLQLQKKFTCSATRNGRLTPEIIWKISLSWMYISTLHSIRIHCFRQPCNSPTLIINGIVKIWQANTPITQCLASTPVSSS